MYWYHYQELEGAAISTIISLCFVSCSYLYMVYPMIWMSLFVKSTTKLELVKFGIPLVGQEVLESVLFIIVFDAFMARLGLEILTIYAVISQLLSIIRVPSFVYSTTSFSSICRKQRKWDMSKNF